MGAVRTRWLLGCLTALWACDAPKPVDEATVRDGGAQHAGSHHDDDASVSHDPPELEFTCHALRWAGPEARRMEYVCVRSGAQDTPFLCSCDGETSLADFFACADAMLDACGIDPGAPSGFCEAPEGTCWLIEEGRAECRCQGTDVLEEHELDGAPPDACMRALAAACPAGE